jgi:thioredoxin-like negative regulator of GroEL
LREVPESAAIRFGFAMLAAAQNSPDEALAALRDAIRRDPSLRAEVANEDLLTPLTARLERGRSA